jgi:hypothetical protein
MVDRLDKSQLLARSLEAAKTSNEHSRAASQTCLIINGGAATAVIAYLSKDKLDPSILPHVALSLVGYGVGVFFAALMIFCATQSLDAWSMYWLNRAELNPTEIFVTRGKVWWWGYYASACLTTGCFIIASIWFAKILGSTPGVTGPCGIG